MSQIVTSKDGPEILQQSVAESDPGPRGQGADPESRETALVCQIPILGTILPNMGMKTGSRRTLLEGAARKSSPRKRTSLSDALFSNTQKRVLGLIFGQPDRSFFASELISLVNAGSGTVQRELERLLDSGLITMTPVGNQKHYRANRAAPIFAELQGLVLKTVGLIDPLRDALQPLAKKILYALVYGSVAKGTDTARSDIDLLIVTDDLTFEDVYAELAPAEKLLARPVNPTILTPKEFLDRKRAGQAFLTRVLSGEHIVLFGSEDAVAAAR